MLTQEQKDTFKATGYLVVRDVLNGELLTDIQVEAKRMAAVESAETLRRVWHERALFRRAAFRKLLEVSQLIEAERDLLGEDLQLLAMDLLFVRAGQGNVGWHRDVTFVCNKTLSINTGIYLQ